MSPSPRPGPRCDGYARICLRFCPVPSDNSIDRSLSSTSSPDMLFDAVSALIPPPGEHRDEVCSLVPHSIDHRSTSAFLTTSDAILPRGDVRLARIGMPHPAQTPMSLYREETTLPPSYSLDMYARITSYSTYMRRVGRGPRSGVGGGERTQALCWDTSCAAFSRT